MQRCEVIEPHGATDKQQAGEEKNSNYVYILSVW